MSRRFIRTLLAVIFALATAVPLSASAMPMPAGMAVQQHCPNCPHHPRTGANLGDMPTCQILACTGAAATLPGTALLLARAFLGAAYGMTPPVRWTGASPAPDPFPPRPVALV